MKRVTKLLRDPFNGEGGGATKVSLHSKRQQQHLLAGKHKAKEEKEVLQCLQCSAVQRS